MHISCVNNNSTLYLKIIKFANGKDSNGIYKQKQIGFHNIGSLDKFDDSKPDYLKLLRESFKDGNTCYFPSK